jgi:hypothetical protein
VMDRIRAIRCILHLSPCVPDHRRGGIPDLSDPCATAGRLCTPYIGSDPAGTGKLVFLIIAVAAPLVTCACWGIMRW